MSFIFFDLETISVYLISQCRMTVLFKMVTYKGCERKRFWLNLNCLLRICTEGLRKLVTATAEVTRPRITGTPE
jgi:hypothetical protein